MAPCLLKMPILDLVITMSFTFRRKFLNLTYKKVGDKSSDEWRAQPITHRYVPLMAENVFFDLFFTISPLVLFRSSLNIHIGRPGSSGVPLPKLLKWFCSAKQNGRRSLK